jgi:hypothetical protein
LFAIVSPTTKENNENVTFLIKEVEAVCVWSGGQGVGGLLAILSIAYSSFSLLFDEKTTLANK